MAQHALSACSLAIAGPSFGAPTLGVQALKSQRLLWWVLPVLPPLTTALNTASDETVKLIFRWLNKWLGL